MAKVRRKDVWIVAVYPDFNLRPAYISDYRMVASVGCAKRWPINGALLPEDVLAEAAALRAAGGRYGEGVWLVRLRWGRLSKYVNATDAVRKYWYSPIKEESNGRSARR